MTLLNVLTQLACSLFFWPATFHCLGLDRAEAYCQQASACSPCTGNENCGCMGYPCPPCPCQPPFCYLGPDGYERIGVDFERLPPPAPCCQMPTLSSMACQPCAPSCYQVLPNPCPMPFQVPLGPAPKVYDVQLRLHPDAEKICLCPRVSMPEGGDAQVSMNCLDSDGNPFCRTLHVHLGKAEGECVPVHFDVTSPDSKKPGEKLAVEQAVHFDTVTGLVLGGSGPEPCLAEVVVSPSKARFAPPTMLSSPMPVGAKSIETVAHVQPPPPPPMPIASSPSFRPVAPMFWRAPIEPSPVSYVPYPPPGFVPAPFQQPGYMPYPPLMLTSIPATMNPPVLPPMDAKVYRAIHPANISVVHESGKAKLQMMKDGVCSTSVRMKLQTEDAGCLQFAASEHHVHLTGKTWKASADHVEMYDDGRMILTGHVKVVSDKVGVCASLKARCVCLRVKHGKVEKIGGNVFSK